MRIGVIGCGFMAAAVVDALAGDGHEILVSERGKAQVKRLNAAYENVTIDQNQNVVDGSDVLIIGLLAEVAMDQIPRLNLRPGHKVISLMAGMTYADLCKLVTPATDITIAIPFPFIASGGAPLLTYPGSQIVTDLFGKRCVMFTPETEDQLNAFMAAQAVLSPVLKMLEASVEWMTDRTGNATQSEAFLRALVGGSLVSRSKGEARIFTNMLAELNTKGGLNAQLRETLVAAGLVQALESGLTELEARLAPE